MNTVINYYVKNVYGKSLIYIADKETARIFKVLTGQETLSLRHWHAFEQLGFSFNEVLAPREN